MGTKVEEWFITLSHSLGTVLGAIKRVNKIKSVGVH